MVRFRMRLPIRIIQKDNNDNSSGAKVNKTSTAQRVQVSRQSARRPHVMTQQANEVLVEQLMQQKKHTTVPTTVQRRQSVNVAHGTSTRTSRQKACYVNDLYYPEEQVVAREPEHQPLIYSAYAQKLMQDTPRDMQSSENNLTPRKKDSDPRVAVKYLKVNNHANMGTYVKKLKRRLTTAAANGSVMELSKNTSELLTNNNKKVTTAEKPEVIGTADKSDPSKHVYRRSSKPRKSSFEVIHHSTPKFIVQPVKTTTQREGGLSSSKKQRVPSAKLQSKINACALSTSDDSKLIKAKYRQSNIKPTKQHGLVKRASKPNKTKGQILTAAQIKEKIKREIDLTSKTSVQLNLLMNKTMNWVMTQDFHRYTSD